MEIDLKLCNFAAEKASLLGACPQQGVGMKVKNKPWHSLNYTPIIDESEDSVIVFTNKMGYNMNKQILGKERMSTDNFL